VVFFRSDAARHLLGNVDLVFRSVYARTRGHRAEGCNPGAR
jgi:hypothetical protein